MLQTQSFSWWSHPFFQCHRENLSVGTVQSQKQMAVLCVIAIVLCLALLYANHASVNWSYSLSQPSQLSHVLLWRVAVTAVIPLLPLDLP